MSLLPIDLQVMFSRMDQIGKEQAIQKQVSPEAQAAQALELVKEAEQRDNSVNESGEVGDGIEKIDEEQKKREKRKRGKEGTRDSSDKGSGEKKNIFQDPALGHHVDLTR